MSYKWTTGSVRRGDIYYEDDRAGAATYIDFGMDTMAFRPAGSAILNLSASNVGIGTVSPSKTLEVVGTVSGSGTLEVGGNAYFGSALNVSGTLYVSSSTPPRGSLAAVMTRAATDGSDPLEVLRLEVPDTVTAGVNTTIGMGPKLSFYTPNSSEPGGSFEGAYIAAEKENTGDARDDMSLTLATCPQSGTVTERMRINSDGNVGINTTSPTKTLEIVGTVSGSSTLEIVGNTYLGGTLNVTGNADFNGTITCDDSITIDSITITDTEFGYLDGLTLGTVATSKVVTADASGDFSGYRNISGSGTLQAVGNTFLGAALNVTGAVTLAGVASGSQAGPSSFLAVNTAGLVVLDEPAGGGGGGSPGGSDTQVQFNDSDSFAGDSGLTFNKTSNVLTVGGLSNAGSTVIDRVDKASGDSPYEMTATDHYIGLDTSGGAIQVDLQGAGDAGEGRVIIIKDETGDAATNNITVDANGSETIDGSETQVINNAYGSLTLVCTNRGGKQWAIV